MYVCWKFKCNYGELCSHLLLRVQSNWLSVGAQFSAEKLLIFSWSFIQLLQMTLKSISIKQGSLAWTLVSSSDLVLLCTCVCHCLYRRITRMRSHLQSLDIRVQTLHVFSVPFYHKHTGSLQTTQTTMLLLFYLFFILMNYFNNKIILF